MVEPCSINPLCMRRDGHAGPHKTHILMVQRKALKDMEAKHFEAMVRLRAVREMSKPGEEAFTKESIYKYVDKFLNAIDDKEESK